MPIRVSRTRARVGLSFRRGPLYAVLPLFAWTRPKAVVWHHPGCPVDHRRQDTADACAARLNRRTTR